MKVVLDNNVVVSGLLSPFGPPGEIMRLVAAGSLTLCVDARILLEYEQVLLRPRFRFDPDAVTALVGFIESSAELAAAQPLAARLPHPDDEAFLEVALACDAAHLVTGNLVHFPPKTGAGVSVVSPAEFVELCRKRR